MNPVFRNWAKFFTYLPGRCRNYSDKREGRMLKKIILKGSKNNKKKSCTPPPSYLHQYSHFTLRTPESRRKTVLNKVFMDQISELMTTGTYATEVYDHGIHVTQTKITPNYHLLYVYWIHTKTINESEVNDLLKKIAAYLREELTSARVMGQIPEVRFVKDQEFMEIQYTEEILDKLKIAENENNVIETCPDSPEQESVSPELESQIPPMDYNVFGLQYLEIMKNIQNEMKKRGAKPVVEVTAESKSSHAKEDIKNYHKKELAKVLFAKRYEIKKSKRASKEAFESELLNTEFDDLDSDEKCEDWPIEDEENEDNHRSI